MRSVFSTLLGIALVACAAQCIQAQPVKPPSDVALLVKGNSEFAVNLYRQLAAEQQGNLFFSPYSISSAFALTYAGARGNTAAEIKATLRFALDEKRMHPAFRQLITHLQGEGKPRPFQLTVANRLWGQKKYGFRPEFVKTGSDFYLAGLEEVDFAEDTDGARQTINRWVEKQTNDKIKELLKAGVLSDMTRLVLTNAIYFKAPWFTPFNKDNTKLEPFHVSATKSVKAPLMQGKQMVYFADHKTFSLLALDYAEAEQAMIVLLPKAKDGLAALEKELSAANLSAWLAKKEPHNVDIKLPRVKLTAEFRLNETLQKLGMKDAFDPTRANFSGMASDGLYLDAALHKAFVDINEAGTEAAAVTGLILNVLGRPPEPVSFHADHPFLFLIRDRRSGTILFLGRVIDPS